MSFTRPNKLGAYTPSHTAVQNYYHHHGPRVTAIMFSGSQYGEMITAEQGELDSSYGLTVDGIYDRSQHKAIDTLSNPAQSSDWFFGQRSEGHGYVTLIGQRDIDRASQSLTVPLTPLETRRNFVVNAVNTTGLIDERFTIGHVMLKGVEACDPLDFVPFDGDPQRLHALAELKGIIAKVLSYGPIKIGDSVSIAPKEQSPPTGFSAATLRRQGKLHW